MSDSRRRPLSERLRGGGLAGWSIRHPVGVTMIMLALVVTGLFSSQRLSVNLLPHIIYPEIRVRILDPGVPASIMEDQVTRQLEEQLAITENAVSVRSRSAEGASSVDLSFPYGTDIDIALRDASTRLDRAKRFLPDTIDPPIIFKRDPAQIPVAEYVVSSATRGPVALRDWVDDRFAKWFLNLPGVAAAEVGGGLVREIHVLPDVQRLAALGLDLSDIRDTLRDANQDMPGGRLRTAGREFSSRTAGRVRAVADIAALPVSLPAGGTIPLGEVARVLDTHEDERMRVRFDRIPGVKLSIQKQPTANTVAVVDAVQARLAELRTEGLIPADIEIHQVADQAVYVRHALRNAAMAAASGALLAMLVVYLFLGDLRRTLVIGSAIPIAVAVTFLAMDLAGLTLNVMTLGGLAVGIGMLVDSTIVMLENIQRHQRHGESPREAGLAAAAEVNSPIVAATSTNLAAILPFLFVGGLTGLLFRELIFTVSAAIFASMVVALTLVPAWAAQLRDGGRHSALRRAVDRLMRGLQNGYRSVLTALLASRPAQLLMLALLVAGLAISVPPFLGGKQLFLPKLDDGRIYMRVAADPGIDLESMDAAVRHIEDLILDRAEVRDMFVLVGGFIFGRTQREISSHSTLYVQLTRDYLQHSSSEQWIADMKPRLAALELAGIRVRMHVRGLRGLRVGQGDDDITLRVQGPDLDVLDRIGHDVADRLRGIPGLRNISWSSEEVRQELAVRIDRERAAQLGLTVADVGEALRLALEGSIVSDFIENDRRYDIRLRLPRSEADSPSDLQQLLLFGAGEDRPAVNLGDVARIELVAAPAEILRANQQRMVEIEASLAGDATLSEVTQRVRSRLADLELPEGYVLYDVGAFRDLQQGQRTGRLLLGLALFLVFVVMAVQYESLRNPLVILLGVPFAAAGVAIGLPLLGTPLSMPVWLGLIMLAGIVVNNAIVLVEYIELRREQGDAPARAIAEAGRLRLRPILMTTLTTVMGLLPLALGLGAGSEMLQPLAQTIILGLSFSLAVTLLLIPVLYLWVAGGRSVPEASD